MSDRITYPVKTNISTDPPTVNQYYATEANEVKDVVNSHADDIENILTQIQTSDPYYGSFSSLAALQAAHPTAVVNAWAIIDPGPGVTPQIASWDDTGGQWEITGAVSAINIQNTASNFPGTGNLNTLYIALNTLRASVWDGSTYKELTSAPNYRPFPAYDEPAILHKGFSGGSRNSASTPEISDTLRVVLNPTQFETQDPTTQILTGIWLDTLTDGDFLNPNNYAVIAIDYPFET